MARRRALCTPPPSAPPLPACALSGMAVAGGGARTVPVVRARAELRLVSAEQRVGTGLNKSGGVNLSYNCKVVADDGQTWEVSHRFRCHSHIAATATTRTLCLRGIHDRR